MQTAKNTILEIQEPVNLTAEESKRFWSKVKKTDSCWLWTGSTRAWRYGSFRFRGKNHAAHRISWRISGKEIISAKPCILHNCPKGDNGLCVNPDHLWDGTQTENILDMERKGRARHPVGNASGMRTCPNSVLRGSKNPQSKLTEAIVLEIYQEALSGSLGTKYKLSKKYKVSHGLIGHIMNGRAWNHVTGLPKRRSQMDST